LQVRQNFTPLWDMGSLAAFGDDVLRAVRLALFVDGVCELEEIADGVVLAVVIALFEKAISASSRASTVTSAAYRRQGQRWGHQPRVTIALQHRHATAPTQQGQHHRLADGYQR
jgi:hypothetical protein